jgi:hypothetical protein
MATNLLIGPKMQKALAAVVMVMLASVGSRAVAQQPAEQPPRQAMPDPPVGLLHEPSFITKPVDIFDRRVPSRREPKDGFYLELGNMITGAGWVAAGPGYRRHVLNDRAVVSASGALSVRLYRMARGGIEFPYLAGGHIRFGAQTLFRDALQVNYYGLGNDSNESDRSGYRLQTSDITTYASAGVPQFSLGARIGWLQPVTVSAMGRSAIYPDTLARFAEPDAPGLRGQPSYLHADVSLTSDTRNYRGHPTAGGFYQATWSVFTDQKTGRNSFQRYEAIASHYVPLHWDNWILALHGSAVLSRVTTGHIVPVYFMPNLGGRNLRGFADYRFHDRNMQSYGIESRWGVFTHVDGVAFVDLGSVAPTVKALRASDLKPSYGVGIRLHNGRVTMARFDVAHGTEGWHFLFKVNAPFRPSTESNGWRTAAPFVP